MVVCRAGSDKLKYYEVVLEEVIIADYAQSARAGVSRPPTHGSSASMAARAAM
nr:Hcp1 family type VI secretion system effector [Pseudomonas plecoglossicida NB2011]